VLGLVALLAQQRACLEAGLEIDGESERGRVGKGEAETVERLGRRFGLVCQIGASRSRRAC
jgi:hypothetical protein